MFLVRKSSKLQKKVLSLRVDDASGLLVSDFPVKESQYTFSLEGSGISFADLFRLVAFYCISRDVLPFTLRIPEAIAAAKTQTDLEEVAQLGAGFWDSTLGGRRRSLGSPSRVATQGSVQLRRQPEGQKAPPRDIAPRPRTPTARPSPAGRSASSTRSSCRCTAPSPPPPPPRPPPPPPAPDPGRPARPSPPATATAAVEAA
ncbi:hypothetical protein AAFF_G00113330 [Aldrovandia affinis]|uniref:Uncharacterized protein n=1 Tax=Aldrovandia affinis TaxID=143900 RepID=A0AAD7WBI2_9TELE|nr:hypothetical protein AAFF_G00113330 [Aldrovandia affinis]